MKYKMLKRVPYVGQAAAAVDVAPDVVEYLKQSTRRASEARKRARKGIQEEGLVRTIPKYATELAQGRWQDQKAMVSMAQKAFANRSRRNPPPQIFGTQHFGERVAERFGSRSEKEKKKLLAVYLALKTHKANTKFLDGRYAIQFGGPPGEKGNYVVVEITRGVVTGFISVLADQHVIVPNTVIVQAKQLGIDLKSAASTDATATARRNPGDPDLYQNVLAHLRAIHWIAWTAHWVASGPNYYGDHLLLRRLYSGDGGGPDIEAAIDTLGEKMVSHFGVDSVNPSVLGAKAQSLVQQAAEGTTGRFQALLVLEQSLQHAIRAAWKANQSSAAMSLGVDDYLMGLANERETAIYLLQRRVGG